RNWDTTTAVFDYGDGNSGKDFQVTFSSRMHNGTERPAEIYYSNGGELNLNTNQISPNGGLEQKHAEAMGMKANLLPNINLADTSSQVVASANTGGDQLTTNHMLNWMECIRSRKEPNAPVEAGYYHSIANVMTTAAAHSSAKATFDEQKQEVMVGDKIFTY